MFEAKIRFTWSDHTDQCCSASEKKNLFRVSMVIYAIFLTVAIVTNKIKEYSRIGSCKAQSLTEMVYCVV